MRHLAKLYMEEQNRGDCFNKKGQLWGCCGHTSTMGIDPSGSVGSVVTLSSNWDMHQPGHELLMDVDRQGLGEEIRENIGPRKPLNREVSLADAVTNPVITKVDAFGLADLDAVVGETVCTAVVGVHDGGRLRMADGVEDSALPLGSLPDGECAAVFGLGSRGDDDIED